MRRTDPTHDYAAAADEEFAVSVESHPAHDHVVVKGHLDIYTSGQVREVIADPERCTRPVLVLDLRGVAFMDSTGLGAIVAARRRVLARQAELRVVCSQGAAHRVIRMTHLDQVLPVFGSLDEAVARS